jgi:hypothetical protein
MPEYLRSLEAGEGGIAGNFHEPAGTDSLRDRLALRDGSLIVPQQRWPDDCIVLVEEDGAMHLARESDRADVATDFGTTSLITLELTSHQSSGCCSDHPGSGA